MKIEYPKPPEPDFMSEDTKYILDVCNGRRMHWFPNQQKNTIHMNREDTLNVKPDLIGDFRHIPFPDETFRLVVFAPPPLRRSGESRRSGNIDPRFWKDDLRAGFNECFRVLIRCGVLVFKWNEQNAHPSQVIPLAPERPVCWQKSGQTHIMVFSKSLSFLKQNQPQTER